MLAAHFPQVRIPPRGVPALADELSDPRDITRLQMLENDRQQAGGGDILVCLPLDPQAAHVILVEFAATGMATNTLDKKWVICHIDPCVGYLPRLQ
jgi:hypothetical protein